MTDVPTQIGRWPKLHYLIAIIGWAFFHVAWVGVLGTTVGTLVLLLPDQFRDALIAFVQEPFPLSKATPTFGEWIPWAQRICLLLGVLAWAFAAYFAARIATKHPRFARRLQPPEQTRLLYACVELLPRVLAFSVCGMLGLVFVAVSWLQGTGKSADEVSSLVAAFGVFSLLLCPAMLFIMLRFRYWGPLPRITSCITLRVFFLGWELLFAAVLLIAIGSSFSSKSDGSTFSAALSLSWETVVQLAFAALWFLGWASLGATVFALTGVIDRKIGWEQRAAEVLRAPPPWVADDEVALWQQRHARKCTLLPPVLRRMQMWLWVAIALIIAVLFVLFTFSPVTFGQAMGPVAIVSLFFAVLLLFMALVSWESKSIDRPIPAIVLGVFALLAVLVPDNSWLTGPLDIHPVRTLRQPAKKEAAQAVDNELQHTRDSVHEAFDSWYERRCPGHDCNNLPLIVVSTAGGGVRAAYWTATVLGGLQDWSLAHPDEARRSFADDVFAISGVSGGSLGAAVFAGLLAEGGTLDQRKPTGCASSSDSSEAFVECGQKVLYRDALGPTLGAMLFSDLPKRVPFLASILNLKEYDRARALERSWETSWKYAFGDSNVRNRMEESFTRLWEDPRHYVPALLFNGTAVHSGKRVITSNLNIGDEFPAAVDFHRVSDASVRLSTAVTNSARFPIIGPAGSFQMGGEKVYEQIVDGGYFENFGATTALDLVRSLRSHAGDKVRFVFVQISSDPSLPEFPALSRDDARQAGVMQSERGEGRALSETAAPVLAVTAVRSARGVFQAQLAKREMALSDRDTYVHFRLDADGDCGGKAPLGWVLSQPAKDALDRAWTNCRVNIAARDKLLEALKPQTPPVTKEPTEDFVTSAACPIQAKR